MEARLFKNNPGNCDYLLVNVDEQGLLYLNQDMPLRVAFFVDNNQDLPWHKRKSMVAIIGKNLDFEKHKVYTEGIFKRGLVDKNYMISYIKEMKKKIIKMAMDDMDIFDKQLRLEDHTQEAVQANEEESKSEPLEVTSEPVAEEPKEYIDTVGACEILKVSQMTLLNLANKGLIKGEHNGFGWSFAKLDIENLLKDQPEFLTKIWKHSKSITRSGGYLKEIVRDNEKYIHVREARILLSLSEATITRHAQAGLLRCFKDNHKKHYISFGHIEELKANPPGWLKKSWSYFNNSKVDVALNTMQASVKPVNPEPVKTGKEPVKDQYPVSYIEEPLEEPVNDLAEPILEPVLSGK